MNGSPTIFLFGGRSPTQAGEPIAMLPVLFKNNKCSIVMARDVE